MKLQLLVTLSLALVVLAACNVSATDNDKDCEKKKQATSHEVSPPPPPQQPSPPIHHHHKHHHRKHRHHRHHRNNSGVNNGGNATPPPPPSQNNNDKNGNNGNGNNGNKNHQLSPQGLKAGISGQEAAGLLSSSISWINNWGAKPYEAVPHGVDFVTQCYGFGMSGHDDDWKRFDDFKKIKPGQTPWVIGPNEIDFKGAASAGYIEPKQAAQLWDQYFGPWKDAGSLLVSPSCAKQRDETYLQKFLDAVTVKPDVINVHVFDDNPAIVKLVLDHYRQYNKPMWITEFACINFKTGHMCSKQETVDFIHAAVDTFENDDQVMAYSYADAENGPHCKLSRNGQLTASGQAYRDATSKYSSKKSKRGMELEKRSDDELDLDLGLDLDGDFQEINENE